MERGAFAVQGILREAVEGGEPDEKRRELWKVNEFEVEFFLLRRLGPGNQQGELERNHRRSGTEFTGDSGEMIASNGADGAADVDDFRGSEIGGKRGDRAAARHGHLNVAQAQKLATAKDNT